MDETLLAEARQAQERLIDAERDADVARAEFHRAVRRLHLHSASLRELASGLGLSHQRVHQIVESAGGSRRWAELGQHLEAGVRIVSPPAREPRGRIVEVPLVHEAAGDRAGAGIQVLVGAPHREIHVPVVQRQWQVADGMRQVEAAGGARCR